MLDTRALPKESDPSLGLLWVDRMELSIRSDVPIATLRFYGVVTDRLCEAARLQTSISHLQAIADLLCRSLDYYPSKPEK